MTDGLCAPPRRGFFSIFVYTRICLSGQSFRGSSILSATSCRLGACHATQLTSGSTSSAAWENPATNGQLPAASDDVLGVHLQSESIILCGANFEAAAGKTNAPSARNTFPLRSRSRSRRLFETAASHRLAARPSPCRKQPRQHYRRLTQRPSPSPNRRWHHRRQSPPAVQGCRRHRAPATPRQDTLHGRQRLEKVRGARSEQVCTRYVPGSARDMADGGSLQICRCP